MKTKTIKNKHLNASKKSIREQLQNLKICPFCGMYESNSHYFFYHCMKLGEPISDKNDPGYSSYLIVSQVPCLVSDFIICPLLGNVSLPEQYALDKGDKDAGKRAE
jgi:hypothetical protein